MQYNAAFITVVMNTDRISLLKLPTNSHFSEDFRAKNHVCRYTTLWNVKCLKATIENKESPVTTHVFVTPVLTAKKRFYFQPTANCKWQKLNDPACDISSAHSLVPQPSEPDNW